MKRWLGVLLLAVASIAFPQAQPGGNTYVPLTSLAQLPKIPGATILGNTAGCPGNPSGSTAVAPCALTALPLNFPIGGGGSTTVASTGGTLALTTTNLQNTVVEVTGTLGSSLLVTFPTTVSGQWTIINATTGAFAVTAGVVGQASPLNVPSGQPRTVASDGTTLYSPVSQATALSTPTTTATNDLSAFGGINGQSLVDTGVAIGTVGSSVPLLSGANTWSGYQTFSGGTNVAANIGSMVVNGDMDVDQQFEGASNSTGIDRWVYSNTAGSGLTMQRTVTVPSGYAHSLKVLGPSTGVSVGASDIRLLRTPVEGSQVSQLQWGQATGLAATLAFQAQCSVTGTYAYAITNSSKNYTWVGTYVIASANTWTSFQQTIAAPANGSPWSSFTQNNYALSINFDLGSGSTYSTTTLNAWQSGQFWTTSGATEIIANNSANCYFTGVHLFAGTNVGTYTPRPYAQELQLAQRYYKKTFPEGTAPAQNAGVAGSLCIKTPVATAYGTIYFQAPSGLYTGGGSAKTVATYNPSATNANWRDVTGAADVTVAVDPSTAFSGTGVQITTSATVANAGDNLCIHAVLSSNFNG